MRLLRIGAILIVGLLTAAQAPDPEKPEENGIFGLLPETSTTRHSLRIDGRTLEYAATAGTLPLRDDKGKRIAAIFHVAYTVEPASAERPVTFVFNGGPGAASAYLHLGAVGPRIVAFSDEGKFLPPPPRLIDNPDTWLDLTDLVFIDPVATGYSRAAGDDEERRERFLGVRQDAETMSAFIRLWLSRAGRMGSPVYLAGESYGGFRAALLADTLQSSAGIAPRGIALISPALEFSLLRGDPSFALLPWALTLPSLAATNFQLNGVPAAELPERLAEVERFALSGYLVHLAAGRQAEPGPVVDQLARFTGMDKSVVARTHARISVSRFIKERAREEGKVLSRYDGTVSGPDPEPASPDADGPDPVLDRSVPVWTTAFVQYIREELGYRTDLTYRLLNGRVSGEWDFGTSGNRQGYAGAMEDLQSARSSVPSMRVLVAHGYTDLVTPYFASRYLFDQLPPLAGAAPIMFRVYGGGHMMYMRPESREALREDAADLYGK